MYRTIGCVSNYIEKKVFKPKTSVSLCARFYILKINRIMPGLRFPFFHDVTTVKYLPIPAIFTHPGEQQGRYRAALEIRSTVRIFRRAQMYPRMFPLLLRDRGRATTSSSSFASTTGRKFIRVNDACSRAQMRINL